jgi:transcriptional regulator with XRE-family HTH domain
MKQTSTAKEVIDELRVELFRKGISQTKLAEITGQAPSVISRRFNRQISPSLADIEAYAAAAGLEVSFALQPISVNDTASTAAEVAA